MDSSLNNSSEMSHGSLQQIREKGGPVTFERRVDDVQQRKSGHTAYLKRLPPDVELMQKAQGKQGAVRKISEPIDVHRKISDTTPASQGRRRSDSDTKSSVGHYPTGPPSPTVRRGSYGHLRRGTLMPPDLRKGSVIPTGWDIHGRKESNQSWPNDDPRIAHLMQKSGLLSQLLQKRYRDDQTGSLRSSDNTLRPRMQLENTYKTQPDEQFEAHVVKGVIQNVLEKNLEHQKYDGPLMGQKSVTLADIIKEKVKSLHYDRYKIISWVVIVQKGCNDLRIASKYVWDKDNDTYAEASFENKSLYALGVCYGVYQE